MITFILNRLVLKEQDVLHLAFYCQQRFTRETPHIFRIARFEKVCTQQRMQDLHLSRPSQTNVLVDDFKFLWQCHSFPLSCLGCPERAAASTDPHLNDSELHYNIMICVGFSPQQQSPTFPPPSFFPRMIFCHCSAAASCKCMAANSVAFFIPVPNFARFQQTASATFCY